MRSRPKNLANLAVLVLGAHPVPQMAVQFAARNAALATVYLALDTESFKCLGRLSDATGIIATRVCHGGVGGGGRLAFAAAKKRAGAAPRPLQVVGPGVAAAEGNGAVLAPVDGI